jgi:hypothetical protein
MFSDERIEYGDRIAAGKTICPLLEITVFMKCKIQFTQGMSKGYGMEEIDENGGPDR